MISRDKSAKAENTANLLNEIFGWIEAILIAVVVSMLIRGFIFETTIVNMSSMEDTLQEGQRLIVVKPGYFFHPPKRGDIVVFEHQAGVFKGILKYFVPFPNPHELDYIKRVIAIPGDKIDIIDGYVYVNGGKISEPYVKGITDRKSDDYPKVVPPDKIFVLGDNREVSSDSREIGFIDIRKIRGRAVFRIWPLKNAGIIR
jgi:signal peptidase I